MFGRAMSSPRRCMALSKTMMPSEEPRMRDRVSSSTSASTIRSSRATFSIRYSGVSRWRMHVQPFTLTLKGQKMQKTGQITIGLHATSMPFSDDRLAKAAGMPLRSPRAQTRLPGLPAHHAVALRAGHKENSASSRSSKRRPALQCFRGVLISA